MQLRFLVGAALTMLLLGACGAAGTGSPTGGSVPSAGSQPEVSTSSQVTATTAPESSATESSVPAPTLGDAPAGVIERCSDVAQVTTDVLSDNSRGDIDPVFHGVLLSYAAEHPDTFGGLWIDREAFGTVVVAFTDDPAGHRDALAARRPSADDVYAVDPPPAITDDRPIGEWGVGFDVVQVAHSDAELSRALDPVLAAVAAVTGDPASGGARSTLNRVTVDLSTPVTPDDLIAITEAIVSLEGVDLQAVCWSGQLADEAPAPIQPGTPLDVISLPSDDGTYPPDTPVACGGTRFALGDLAELTPAAEVELGLRRVLDDWLAGAEGEYWPQENWSLLYENGEHAAFVHVSDTGMSVVGAEMGANGWIWAGASGGGDCDVQLLLPDGLGAVEWELDPGALAPDASATEIRVLATESACASGQAMGDRLLGPQVVETADTVRIAFAAIPHSGAQTCPSNPSTPVVVALSEPLGDREIGDGLALGPITSLVDM